MTEHGLVLDFTKWQHVKFTELHQGTNTVAIILYKRCCVTQQTKHENGTENIRNSCLDMTKLWMVLKTERSTIYSHSTDGVRPWTLGIRQPVVGLSQ